MSDDHDGARAGADRAAPFAGIRVLDFAWVGAGALVTKALAELGAEVVRIESRARPDNLRLSPPFRPGARNLDGSGYFASRNPNKKSVALNMKHPEARDIALALAARSNVVTSNFRTGVLERWGLGYDDVRAVNPGIIFLVMPMQGGDGPHRDFVGFGSTISALSGLVHTSGLPDRPPVGTGTHYPDHVPNPGHALVVLLAALLEQKRTGAGCHLELSQLESTVNVLGPAVLDASLGGSVSAQGNALPGVCPRGVYRVGGDRFVAIACPGPAHWDALLEVLDAKDLATDPRFVTLADREAHRDALDAELAGRIADHDRHELVAALRAVGVPASVVNDPSEVLDDHYLVARDFWPRVDHPVIGDLPLFHLPFTIDGVPRGRMRPPPLLGEHTEEVATGLLGMSPEDYRRRVDEGVFR